MYFLKNMIVVENFNTGKYLRSLIGQRGICCVVDIEINGNQSRKSISRLTWGKYRIVECMEYIYIYIYKVYIKYSVFLKHSDVET